MNVKEILVSWLKQHGYDGLYYQSDRAIDCGCEIDGLLMCRNYSGLCKPGIKKENWFIGPRKEKQPEEICQELECSGIDDKCPGNPMCPAVQFSQEKPVDCKAAVEYMKSQINLTRRCSFCHGENSEDCDHCSGSGNEPDKT